MAERRGRRIADSLSQGDFTLERTRPPLFRAMLRALVCVFCAVAGAVGITAWHAYRADLPPQPCVALPVDENQQQTELARARLALAEESAARAAVQTSADKAAAEVARLAAELRFLRGQSGGQSASPRH
ncbi:hypothetical protein SAMN05443245_3911 [Paraburkholderia fungorum]|uniref:Uncharacterized protein n=1 Tax=Paraburkholderia fungorum TaxID=134537 RepID=A0A1H1HHE8_9BURK|nr:hypothetical protein [Paraburkholderia fungorum]SDR24833.1 hypothetical protein SAMN05443245_3911 [Paraburkholderia fungorum]